MTDDELPAPNGRAFTVHRTVRLGDTWPNASLRFDALARYLQDIASDDMADVGLGATVWVVRKAEIHLDGRPSLSDALELTTFCSGLGGRWARRRTSVVGPDSRIEVSALWVHIDPSTGAPVRYPAGVTETWGAAVAGRKVSGRLTLPDPPADAPSEAWPVRPVDFDVLDHVNNAVYWTAADDPEMRSGRTLLEYRTPIGRGLEITLRSSDDRNHRWLVSSEGVHAAAFIDPFGPPPGGASA